MKKLNWREDADYDYTDKLDSKGWAWEFIRRSDSYQHAFKEITDLVLKEYDSDWKKQKIVQHVPERYENETEQQWFCRADTEGLIVRSLTNSQQVAAQWSLFDMYDPDLKYDSQKIFFDLRNPYPAYFGMMPDFSEEDVPDGEKERSLSVYKKLHHINHVSDIENSSLINENVLLVAFDTRRSVNDLLAMARPILVAHGELNKKFKNSYKNQRQQWRKYIRMLDAANSGEDISKKAMIMYVEPDDVLRGKKYADMDVRHISDHAVNTLKQACEVAESGFRGILYDIEFKS
jgi:hypothetical protein